MKKRMLVIMAACVALSLIITSFGGGLTPGAEEDWSSTEARLELYAQLQKATDPEEFFMGLSPEAQEALIAMLTPTEYDFKIIEINNVGDMK